MNPTTILVAGNAGARDRDRFLADLERLRRGAEAGE